MTVFVLMFHDYDAGDFIGAFSTQALADAEIDRLVEKEPENHRAWLRQGFTVHEATIDEVVS